MSLHVETPLVKMFGNSVIFADKLDMLPMIFQPILFYPDWYFVAWPFELIAGIVARGNHPYFNSMGPGALGWAIVWFILGFICGINGASDTFTSFSTPKFYPVHREFIHKLQCSGILGQLIGLPLVIVNGVYKAIYKLVAYLLFWHIVIGRIIGLILTQRDWMGDRISPLVRGIVYIAMLLPPLVSLTLFILETI